VHPRRWSFSVNFLAVAAAAVAVAAGEDSTASRCFFPDYRWLRECARVVSTLTARGVALSIIA